LAGFFPTKWTSPKFRQPWYTAGDIIQGYLSVSSLSTRFKMGLVPCVDQSSLCFVTNNISEQTHSINFVNDNISVFLNHYYFIPGLQYPSPPTATTSTENKNYSSALLGTGLTMMRPNISPTMMNLMPPVSGYHGNGVF
jgi:hypothetical protein